MNKNGFYELIKNRRSIRAFDTERKVPENTIVKILEAGRLAPTASNKQPVKFHVVQERSMLRKLHNCYSRSWFRDAPSVLVLTGRREDAWVRTFDGYNSLEIDAAIMMDHMILAAESEGISTCWIIAFDPAVVKEVLELKADEIPLIMTPLGYFPDGYVKREMPERKSLKELVTYY